MNKNQNFEELQLIKSLIKTYQNTIYRDPIKIIKSLLQSFPFAKHNLKKINQLELSKILIDDFKNSQLLVKAMSYDFFRELRLIVNENAISNIIRSVLDPKISPFGKSILIHVLELTGRSDLSKIIKNSSNNNIHVQREWSGEQSRIDIRVITKNANKPNTIIDFELKVEGGSETINDDGEYQTNRQWEDLRREAKNRNIDYKNIVAYYVSPHGTNAKCRHFIPIERNVLNNIIIDNLKIENSLQQSVINQDSIGALRHFFNSSWIF